MTRLRKLMLDELERRNYTQTTRRAYLLGHSQGLCQNLCQCNLSAIMP